MINEIVDQIEIEATPDEVFDAWTRPEQLIEWWGEEGVYRTINWTVDLREDGKWRADGVNAEGKGFSFEGKYLIVDRSNYLSFTWRHSREDHLEATIVEVEFQKSAKGTLLTLRHRGFTNQASRNTHKKGWARVLRWVCGYVENKSTLKKESSD